MQPLQTAAQLLSSTNAHQHKAPLITYCPALNALQNGGLARGSVVEINGARSSGRFALGMSVLSAATQAGETSVLVDLGDQLDPAMADDMGVQLERLLWLRPTHVSDALTCAEMVLSTGFSVVVLDLGCAAVPLRLFTPAVWMRFARAAQAQKGILLILSPHPLEGSADLVVTTQGHADWQGTGPTPRLLTGISVDLQVNRRKKVAGVNGGRMNLNTRDAISSSRKFSVRDLPTDDIKKLSDLNDSTRTIGPRQKISGATKLAEPAEKVSAAEKLEKNLPPPLVVASSSPLPSPFLSSPFPPSPFPEPSR